MPRERHTAQLHEPFSAPVRISTPAIPISRGQGVNDPAKVVGVAFCCFVAGHLVTTEAMVAEKPKPKAPPVMPDGGGTGDRDY